jgi:hypothetical protein
MDQGSRTKGHRLARAWVGSVFVCLLFTTGCRLMPHSAAIVWDCSRQGLPHALLQDLCRAVDAYAAETGDNAVTITSGHRTLRRQAELMAAFSQDQLMGLYGRHGTPSYVTAIAEFRNTNGRAPTADEVYRILRHRRDGYISSHLYGGAVDIASRSVQNMAALRAQLAQHNFRTLDERSQGIACLHATHLGTPKRIVRD